MAQNYCQSSTLVLIEPGKIEQAKAIVARIREAFEIDDDGEGIVGFQTEIWKEGIWLGDDECFNPEHAEVLIRSLVEELELDDVYVCSWAYTCSKLRIGEFGGGAFAVSRGKNTVWIDAVSEARRIANASGV
jgi:hypothetical protein